MVIEYGWPLGGGLRYSSAFCRWRGVEERKDAMMSRPIAKKKKEMKSEEEKDRCH